MSTAAIVVAVVGVGAAAGLVAIVRTRWLQSRTLEKCVALSVALHAVIAAVCGLVGGWAPASWGRRDDAPPAPVITLGDDADGRPVEGGPADEGEVAGGIEAAEAAATAGREPPPPLVPVAAPAEPLVAGPPADHVPLLDAPAEASADAPAPADTPAADAVAATTPGAGTAATDPAHGLPHLLPSAYADRVGERRAAAALARGGSEATEEAVRRALRWLVAAQSSDGRWDAARHGAGHDHAATGQHRAGTAGRCDHGVSGLALLALLGAGSTHRDGPHADAVDRGIRFLTGRQRADGSLAGDAEFFAALYCHGMATIAVAECLAMTGDAALRPVVERAVAHTLAMQHPHTGGWRYAAGDRGDTSQCGWQVMVLATARNAGLGGFDGAEARARVFLGSVAGGPARGLASYRVGERPSPAMTAEALYCRLVLGGSPAEAATGEALAFIAASPPVPSAPNAYAWYYATLASFHAGGPHWEQWNARLQATLVPLQRRDGGAVEGSWDPDPVWGGQGGRVYSTALSALTLEIYYRHRPLHERGQRLAATPAP
ncbi:MAG: terpene cyclase/mutase family protein [Planctomycetes bacterium]|nr:terpene cyclase/mutase family protein [Planctomycetota bacterium]